MARFKQDTEDMAYRIYVSDRLYAMTQGTGKRYVEYIGLLPKDNRTVEEVTNDIVKRAGLVVK